MSNTRIWKWCGYAALVWALAAAMQAQTYSVLYNFGDVFNDAGFPQDSGIIAQGRDGNLYTTTPYGGANNVGTVIKITPAGQVTVLYNFNNADPDEAYPFSGLTLGTDGNFYGATLGALDTSGGKVFQVTPTGEVTFLHTFVPAEGRQPYAPPIQGADGYFYGTTTGGGASGYGTVYRMTPFGQFKTIGSFNFTNGYHPLSPLVEGSDGNFYGTTWEGGTNGVGTVFRITTKGKITTMHNFDWSDGAYTHAPLVQGSDGNLYGVGDAGGASGFGTIFRVSTKKTFKVLHSFSASDGEYSSAGLLLGSDGNFYGSTVGASNFGAIYRVTPGGDFSVLHAFDLTHGANPQVTLTQHTTGILYGETFNGGTHDRGTVYSLNAGLPPFAELVPRSGKVGDKIAILGQGLSNATAVSFNGTPTIFAVGPDTWLVANVPDGAKTGPVTVTTAAGNLVSNRDFLVTPVITSFNPSRGPVGIQVNITGVSLAQTTAVTFGTKAASFTVNSDHQVTAIVPAKTKSGKISVTTAGGVAISSTRLRSRPK